jgi:hypothetical protein
MGRTLRLLRSLLFAVVASGLGGCDRPTLPTVKGPEATDLLPKITGAIVTRHRAEDGRITEIAVLSLPDLKETVIRPEKGEPYEYVSQVSGPDAEGRIAYVQENLTGGTARLKTIRADGSNDQVILSRSGKSYEVFGKHPVLSPTGNLIALIIGERSLDIPGTYLRTGSLEIWDVVRKIKLGISVEAEEHALYWFPDGRRLAYVEFVSKKRLPTFSLGPDDFGKEFSGWSRVPAVHVLDVMTGQRNLICIGWQPVVSADGKSILVEDSEGHRRKVDIATGRSQVIQWPGALSAGDHSSALALLPGDLVLYWGLPTEGSPVVRSPYGSFRAGTQMVTLKLAEIHSGKFQTVVPAIDPRHDASFGRVSRDVLH